MDVVAVGYVVEADDKVTPMSGISMAAMHHEKRNADDDLAKSMLETLRSSILQHEKMTEWLREESTSLKQEKANLKTKLRA